MARSYDIAILSQKVEQLEGREAGTNVIANPEEAATSTLEKVQISETIYSIPGIYDDIAVVNGTLASGDNEFDYPAGFTVSNCVIISIMYQPGTDRWDTLPNSNYATVLGSLRASKIVFYNGASGIDDKPIRIVLKKIPIATQSTRSRKKKED